VGARQCCLALPLPQNWRTRFVATTALRATGQHVVAIPSPGRLASRKPRWPPARGATKSIISSPPIVTGRSLSRAARLEQGAHNRVDALARRHRRPSWRRSQQCTGDSRGQRRHRDGRYGSDVTKSVAGVVLADDKFATIVIGVREGFYCQMSPVRRFVMLLVIAMLPPRSVF
jgi:hypothetical protein